MDAGNFDQTIPPSLDENDEADAQSEWLALAGKRMADVKAGTVVGIPADEVLRNLSTGRLSSEQRAELFRRDTELDANPEIALTWEQIRTSVERRV